MESASTGFSLGSHGSLQTQESNGGGLLSMRPTAGRPARMKCFLSLNV